MMDKLRGAEKKKKAGLSGSLRRQSQLCGSLAGFEAFPYLSSFGHQSLFVS